MRCNICGHETNETIGTCPNCTSNPNRVQVLSPEERENFNGPTIDEDNSHVNSGQSKSFQKIFIFNSNSAGTMTKLVLGGVLLFFIIVFLPLALFLAATLGLNWLAHRSRQ